MWDFQFNAQDRLIGSTECSAGELLRPEHRGPQDPRQQTYARLFHLSPPSLLAQTGSLVDRASSVLTFGPASKPGEVSVLSAQVLDTPELAATHNGCFDVDTILREKKVTAPLRWETLTERRNKVTAKIRSGRMQIDTTFTKRLHARYTNFKNYLAHLGVTKYLYRFAPFYQSRRYIGARFGSAFEAFFSFSYLLVKINFLLAIIWFLPVVLIQTVFMSLSPDQVRSPPHHPNAAEIMGSWPRSLGE